MRKILPLFIAVLVIKTAAAQQPLKHARQASWETLVYRIAADTAEVMLTKGRPDLSPYYQREPFATWKSNATMEEGLPIGHYLFLSIVGNELVYEYFNQTAILARPVNNNHRVQLELRNTAGSVISNARIWVEGRERPYIPAIAGFIIPGKYPEDDFIKIAIPGDTTFIRLSAMEEEEQVPWWTRVKNSKTGRILRWPARKLIGVFNPHVRFSNKKHPKGYMIFNQAMYRTGDTLRFKAYILNKHSRRFRHRLNLALHYWLNGRSVETPLAKLRPAVAGSYVYEFVLGDSLPSDLDYAVRFTDRKKHDVLSGLFRIEDYLNDEVVSHTLKASSAKYHLGDSLLFTLSAKDAAGLPVMDGRVRFYLLASRASMPGRQEVFVPDTIFRIETQLLADQDTRVLVPASMIPDAQVSLRAKAEFINGNNEVHTETADMDFNNEIEQILASPDACFLQLEYRINGVAVDTSGVYTMDDGDMEYPVRFPSRIRINPFAESYEFSAGDAYNEIKLDKDNYRPRWKLLQEKDSCGFILENPYRLLMHYSVFFGRKLIAAGADSSLQVIWKDRLGKNTTYEVVYRYFWQGEEMKEQFNVYALDKLLTGTIDQKQTIYPGQTDTIRVKLTDRKGRPAANVNLTAVTYNSQQQKNIRVPEPPYLQRMRNRMRVKNDDFEQDPATMEGRFPLADYISLRKKFSVDTMPYYQLLKPVYPFTRISTRTSDAIPQVSVYVVRHGKPEEIHFLYVNNQFVWYNGASDQPAYVFHGVHGYNRFGIRLDSQYIVIDSVYLQPFYKHDLSFDLDSLPAGSVKTPLLPFLNNNEKYLLEHAMLRLQPDDNSNNAWVWQAGKLVWLARATTDYYHNGIGNRGAGYRSNATRQINPGQHFIGPFNAADTVQYYKPGAFDLRFPLEPGYIYQFSPGVSRLLASQCLPVASRCH